MKHVSLCKLTCETIFMIDIDEMLPKLLHTLKYSMGFGVSFKYFFELLFLPEVYLRNLSHSPRLSSQKNGPACTNYQNGRRTDSEESSKGPAIQNSTWKWGTHVRKTHASRARQNACKCFKLRFNVWRANNFNNTSLNLLEKENRGIIYLRRVV